VQNKIHEFECWKKEEHNRKIIHLAVDKNSNLQTLCRKEPFCEAASKSLEKINRAVKIFYSEDLSIYRGEGSSFQKSPRFDRCEFFRGRVSTPTFRGWRFLPEFKSFYGNRSSESTRFLEGLVLANLGENITPTELRICRSSWDEFSGDVRK
jgi:hypothetical protein